MTDTKTQTDAAADQTTATQASLADSIQRVKQRIAQLTSEQVLPDSVPGVCPWCDNSGWRETNNRGNRVVKPCGQAPFIEPCERPEAAVVVQGVPAGEVGKTLLTYQATDWNADALKHAQLFLKGIHPDLYLFGGVGSGKTLLAICILNELAAAKTYRRLRFVRVSELLRHLQGFQDPDETDWFEDCVHPQVLVLDDVGASQATDFARRMLQTIYDARRDRDRRTIFTSNLAPHELAEFMGQDARLVSRIAGNCRVVHLDGPDMRLAKNRKTVVKR